MNEALNLQNKLFIVGSRKSKDTVNLGTILSLSELMINSDINSISKRDIYDILIPLDDDEVLVSSMSLAQKIVNDMKLVDMDDEESFRFSFNKCPLIQLSYTALSSYYTDIYSKFVNDILKMRMEDFMNREKFDAVIAEAIDYLDRIFIWHVDFDSPMSLDMYLKYFAHEMDTDEDDLFNIYVYEVYDINPSAMTVIPWYNITR